MFGELNTCAATKSMKQPHTARDRLIGCTCAKGDRNVRRAVKKKKHSSAMTLNLDKTGIHLKKQKKYTFFFLQTK